MPIKNTFTVLETVAATAADYNLNNSILTIKGMTPIDFRKIESYTRTPQVAGTSGTLTITTPTPTANLTSVVVVNQYVRSLGKIVSATLTCNHTGSITSATNIADAFRAQLRNFGLTKYFNISLNADGNATVVITPVAPDNFINGVSVGTQSNGVATTTQAARVGYGADLLLEGITGVTSTNYYTRYEWVHASVDTKGTAGANDVQVVKQTLLVNGGATATPNTNADNLNTAIQNGMAAQAPAQGSSIEQVAVV